MGTSRLQEAVNRRLRDIGKYTIWQNYRPEWLMGDKGWPLELDFYIEEIDVAIEVQGEQHYVYKPGFHKDATGFAEQLHRDRLKRKLCEERGIELLEIAEERDADRVIQYVTNYVRKSDDAIQLSNDWAGIQKNKGNEIRKLKNGGGYVSTPLNQYSVAKLASAKANPQYDKGYTVLKSGYVVGETGAKLMRIDQKSRTMFFYDKFTKGEIAVNADELLRAMAG